MSSDLYTLWLDVPSGPRPPDHYTLLGLPRFCKDQAQIEAAAQTQLDKLDQFILSTDPSQREACQQMMDEVDHALMYLNDPIKKSDYDFQLKLAEKVAPIEGGPVPGVAKWSSGQVGDKQGPAGSGKKSGQVGGKKDLAAAAAPLPGAGSKPVAPVSASANRASNIKPQTSPIPAPIPGAGNDQALQQSSDDQGKGPILGLARPVFYLLSAVVALVLVNVIVWSVVWSIYHVPVPGPGAIPGAGPVTDHHPVTVTQPDTQPVVAITTPILEPDTQPATIFTLPTRGSDTQPEVTVPPEPHVPTAEELRIAQEQQRQAQEAQRLADEQKRLAQEQQKLALRNAHIADLLTTARANQAGQNNDAALVTLNELLAFDPGNAEAVKLRTQIMGAYTPGITITNSIEMKLACIPAGEFLMGSPETEEGHKAAELQHKVIISKLFFMSVTEVTQRQWKALMGADNNPSHVKADDQPVERITWDEARDFCKKLSQKEGKKYRLPTEAEWEYACRAGSTGPFGGTGKSDEMGWYEGNAESKIHPVGQKQANAWGLFDMHGNVCEWCADWYGDYPTAAVTDPTGAASGDNRVTRGGGWFNPAAQCRSAYRGWSNPGNRERHSGLRVVYELP